jgi:hypothetical protein
VFDVVPSPKSHSKYLLVAKVALDNKPTVVRSGINVRGVISNEYVDRVSVPEKSFTRK